MSKEAFRSVYDEIDDKQKLRLSEMMRKYNIDEDDPMWIGIDTLNLTESYFKKIPEQIERSCKAQVNYMRESSDRLGTEMEQRAKLQVQNSTKELAEKEINSSIKKLIKQAYETERKNKGFSLLKFWGILGGFFLVLLTGMGLGVVIGANDPAIIDFALESASKISGK